MDADKTGTSGILSRRGFLQKAGAGVATAMAAGALGAPAAIASSRAPLVLRTTPKTVRVAMIGTLSPQFKNVFGAFEKKHPGVKVDYIGVQALDWDGLVTKLLTMAAAGRSPDLTYVATEGVQQVASKGLSSPLDDYVKRDRTELMEYFADVHPALVESYMYQGHLYQLPGDFNAVDMYYNTPVLRQAGFSEPPATWDKNTFYKIAKAITKKDSHGRTTRFGYGWVIRLWGSWTPWIDTAGGDLLTFGRWPGGSWLWDTFYKNNPQAKGRGGGIKWGAPTANSPACVEALQFMVQLVKEGITPIPNVNGGGALQGFFANGRLGMTPGGGFWAGGLHSAGMKPGTFDVQFFPRWRTGRTHFGTAGYAILNSAKDKDLAWEFYKYAISKEAMTYQLAGNGTTPVRRSMMTAARYAPTGPKHWQVFYQTLDHAGTRAMPAPPYYTQLADVLNKFTSQAMTGGATPKQALDGMQRQLESIYSSSY